MIFKRAAHTSSTHGKHTEGWNLHPRAHKPESNIGQSFRFLMTVESVFELHGEAGFAKDTKQEKGAPRAFRICLTKQKQRNTKSLWSF